MKVLVTLFLILCLGLPAGPALSTELESKRQEAERLRAELTEHGRRLSMAGEDYNEAVWKRERLSTELAAKRAEVSAAEDRWRAQRDRLGRRARALYMYPGAALEAWLGMRSVTQASRAAAFSGAVLGSDAELMAATASARRELEGEVEGLGVLRADAERLEADLAERRVVLEQRVADQRALVAGVEGEIAELIEAQRQAEIEAARQAAEAEAARVAEETVRPEELVFEDPAEGEEVSPDAGPASSNAATAVRTARRQMGKPYQWGASGPNSFDCSGLTSYAWAAAGVSLPRSSRAQYAALPKVRRADLRPGDLVFFGSPIHHVGIYEGNGVMINSPETGETVRRDSIGRSDYAGAVRPR